MADDLDLDAELAAAGKEFDKVTISPSLTCAQLTAPQDAEIERALAPHTHLYPC